MPVDDRTRLNLLRRLEAVLGSEEANTLMAHLPPVTWNEVATKDDLDALGTALRGDMKSLETSLRSELHVGFAELRTEMATLRTDIADATSRQLMWMVTFAAAWSSLLIAAVRLIP